MFVETLAAVAATLLSLLFSFLPGLAEWYEGLSPTAKRLVMLGALLVVNQVMYLITPRSETR